MMPRLKSLSVWYDTITTTLILVLQCGWTPLHLAAIKNNSDVAKLLLRLGADVNTVDYVSTTFNSTYLMIITP